MKISVRLVDAMLYAYAPTSTRMMIARSAFDRRKFAISSAASKSSDLMRGNMTSYRLCYIFSVSSYGSMMGLLVSLSVGAVKL